MKTTYKTNTRLGNIQPSEMEVFFNTTDANLVDLRSGEVIETRDCNRAEAEAWALSATGKAVA